MRIQAVHVRRFRCLERADLADCAGLNVIIGRNNAGKSTILATIEMALERLRSGRIAFIWHRRHRPEDQLLRLKTKRGGAEALARLQKTVRALLGVTVDAFEPELPAGSPRDDRIGPEAEMDVDDFLVQANGAGIREALRIILDLELRTPSFALIEEPEVHLHPGLERILHNYLVQMRDRVQLFVATHSANFLDASTRQNVYLVARSGRSAATVRKVASEDDLLKVSEEVGLRPSTVLLFDQLVFVEGPSDEGVLNELSQKLDIDIAGTNTAFVQMGGATRFAHYAAEATLDLLSRRRVKMWFLIDRDDRDDADIEKLLQRLGERAELVVLAKRELENYLLVPEAVRALIAEKLKTGDGQFEAPTAAAVRDLITRCAAELLERAIELRIGKQLLKPAYADQGGANTKERLTGMLTSIERRLSKLEEVEAATRASLTATWGENAVKLAPGSEILDAVLKEFGLRYKKEVDGRRLAEKIDINHVDSELARFLRQIAQPG